MPSDVQATTTEPDNGPALVQPGLRWAVVDLMGRNCIAGAVSLEDMGDRRLVRVDVPEVATPDGCIPAHAKSFGAAAVFSIAWCDETAALAVAQLIRHTPPCWAAIKQEADHASR